MSKLLKVSNSLVKANGSLLSTSSLNERYEFVHLWVGDNMVTYEDDGVTWSIPATTRVLEVPDLGSGNLPLRLDPEGSFGDVFAMPPLPGPRPMVACPRFNGHLAWWSDTVLNNELFFDNFHSMLAPLPKGVPLNIPQPFWWVAVVAFRNGVTGHEVTALDGDPGWLTVGPHGDGFWEAAAWVSFPAPLDNGGMLSTSTLAIDSVSTFVIGGHVNGASSLFRVARRNAAGQIETESVLGTQGNSGLAAGPCHFGWSFQNYTFLCGVGEGTLPDGVFESALEYVGPSGAADS